MNDLISRQAAIDAIERHKTAVLGGCEWDEGIAYGYAAAHRHLVDIVKQLPSAQQCMTATSNTMVSDTVKIPVMDGTTERLSSSQPEYYDYSDIDDIWEYYAEEQDIKLTDSAKQLKDAMWVGYRKGKQDAQSERKNVVEIPETGIGDLSDGYHTFNGLYEQRMVLFAALVKAYKEKAWKSYRHEDGEYCFGGGWFIVGIDTPEGSYTYHYENKYWNMFDCIDLPRAKHWDGHTEEDAETRLMSLEP